MSGKATKERKKGKSKVAKFLLKKRMTVAQLQEKHPAQRSKTDFSQLTTIAVIDGDGDQMVYTRGDDAILQQCNRNGRWGKVCPVPLEMLDEHIQALIEIRDNLDDIYDED